MSLFRHLLLFNLVHDPYRPLYKTHISCFNLLVIFALFNVPRLQQFHTTVAVTQVQNECIRHRLKVQTLYSSANNWLKERTMSLRRWPKKSHSMATEYFITLFIPHPEPHDLSSHHST